MSNLAPQSRAEAIKDFVTEITAETWKSSSRVLMLARLGQALSRKGFDLKNDLRGEKLAEFITREMGGVVQVLTSPVDPLTKGIVPADVNLESDTAIYFSKPNVTSVAHSKERFSFDKRIWIAFSRELAPNCVREISLEPEIQFQDLEKGSEVKGALYVPSELVVAYGTQPKNERELKIYNNILEWIKSNSISLDQVTVLPKETNEQGNVTETALSILLRALDRNDLQRISLPLDIIAKLQKNKVKA